MADHYLWSEKYRPQSLSECVLPERLRSLFQEQLNKDGLTNMILSGSAGVGKTTVARALCNDLNAEVLQINGSDESGIDTVRTKIVQFASSFSMQGSRKYVLIDEADYLNPNSAQPALRGVIEEFAKSTGFLFTVNFPYKLIDPLHSRCPVVSFTYTAAEAVELKKDIFRRTARILKDEGVTFDKQMVGQAVLRSFPDFRRLLNTLQRAVKDGALVESLLVRDGDAEFGDLWEALRKKNYKAMRTWVAQHEDIEDGMIVRSVQDWIERHAKLSCAPATLIRLADYQSRAPFAADRQVHWSACFVELMTDLEF